MVNAEQNSVLRGQLGRCFASMIATRCMHTTIPHQGGDYGNPEMRKAPVLPGFRYD